MSKALGLDLGTRTLGIAESDSAGWYAYGIETFRFNEGNYKAAIQRVLEITKKDGTIVSGYYSTFHKTYN